MDNIIAVKYDVINDIVVNIIDGINPTVDIAHGIVNTPIPAIFLTKLNIGDNILALPLGCSFK